VLANWAAAPADRLVDAIRRLRASLAQIGGGLVVERCPSAVAALIEVWGVDGRDVALMQRLKQTYDPNSTLNPGRFAGRI
jgi:glycolate oxidase FAD binding subunit